MSVKTYLAVSMPSRILSSDRTSLMGFLSGRMGGICNLFFASSVANSVACQQRNDKMKVALLRGVHECDVLGFTVGYLPQLLIRHEFIGGRLQLLF